MPHSAGWQPEGPSEPQAEPPHQGSSATPPSSRSVRMTYPKQPDNTLNGYIFADVAHARLWLSQPFVERSEIHLEEVELGTFGICRHCRGTGYLQPVKRIRALTFEALFRKWVPWP